VFFNHRARIVHSPALAIGRRHSGSFAHWPDHLRAAPTPSFMMVLVHQRLALFVTDGAARYMKRLFRHTGLHHAVAPTTTMGPSASFLGLRMWRKTETKLKRDLHDPRVSGFGPNDLIGMGLSTRRLPDWRTVATRRVSNLNGAGTTARLSSRLRRSLPASRSCAVRSARQSHCHHKQAFTQGHRSLRRSTG